MFLTKFPGHEYSSLRVGMLIAMHEDCPIISVLRYFPKVLGMKPIEACEYLFDGEAVREFNSITREGEEIEDLNSYATYFRPLGISTRSPYSVSANKNYHTLVHMICALLGQERSLNSRVMSEVPTMKLMEVGMFVAFAVKHSKEYRQYIFSTQRAAEDYIAAAAVEEDVEELEPEEPSEEAVRPRVVTPLGVLKWMKSCGGVPPSPVFSEFRKYLDRLSGLRPGSIGMFLKVNLNPPST